MKSKDFGKKRSHITTAFIIVGLVSLLGLGFDSGHAYFERRNAQQAAELAARAGAQALAQGQDFTHAARYTAAGAGYDNDGTRNTVTVNHPPGMSCTGTTSPHAGNNEYVQVVVQLDFQVYFAQVVGIREAHTCVEAVEQVTSSAYSSLE